MNDERPIEKLLRRAAQKRGDEAGPPPELHPANRRVLQGEVARQFPKLEATKQSAMEEFWAGLKRRWVYGGAAFAVLWVVAIALVPNFSKSKTTPETKLAQRAPSDDRAALEKAPALPIANEPVIATATFDSDRNSALGLSGGGNLKDRPTSAAAPAALPPAPRQSAEATTRRLVQTDSPSRANAVTVTGTVQPPIPDQSKTKFIATDETAALDETAPASLAQRTQASRTRSAIAGVPGGPAGSTGLELKNEKTPVAGAFGAERKEVDSLAPRPVASSAISLSEATAESLADKTPLPRGGGAEPERPALSWQAFSNVSAEDLLTRRKDAPAIKVPVLANFQIQQQGENLRVVDGDGSIYRGYVDETNTLYKQVIVEQNKKLAVSYDNALKFQSPKVASASPAQNQQKTDYYLYRVEGTNRTLNQNVVFTWNFTPTNETLAAVQLTYKAAAQKLDTTKMPSQFPELLQNSYINGRAQFGENREIEVNAVPVKP